MTEARYIVFEGIDASGKSTQIARLSAQLRKLDLTPIELFEPTYGPFGREMREYIAKRKTISVARQIELFTRDRREHVRTRIGPLLGLMERNAHFAILQHRYYLSAPAYQAEKSADMVPLLRSQQAIAPKPDVVVLLDVSAAVAMRRLSRRRKRLESFERLQTLEAARQRYLDLSKECSETIIVVNGVGPIERVRARVWQVLRPKMFALERGARHEL